MYYYDHTTGDMEWTTDAQTAARNHALVMITAHRYPLNEQAAGQLWRVLGPVDPDATRAQALRQVSRALAAIGMKDVPVTAVLEQLPEGWQLAVGVGS